MKKERENKNEYEAPKVECLEVQVERGFSSSVGVGGVGVGGWGDGSLGNGEATEQ